MVEHAGGRGVAVAGCPEGALVDGTANYLLAVQHVVDDPSCLREALTQLLDGAQDDEPAEGLFELEVPVGDSVLTVRRATAFTLTEEVRATAFASVVADLVAARGAASPAHPLTVPDPRTEPVLRVAGAGDAQAVVRMADRCSTRSLRGRFGVPLAALPHGFAVRLLEEGQALVAEVGSEVVALATIATGEDPAEVALLVEDDWQRTGLGTRLLGLAARVAKGAGAAEIVLRGGSDDVVPRLSAASGLNGRMRHEEGGVVLTVSLRRLAPPLARVGA
jgi:GNAT superfamily N-acetyltransferase